MSTIAQFVLNQDKKADDDTRPQDKYLKEFENLEAKAKSNDWLSNYRLGLNYFNTNSGSASRHGGLCIEKDDIKAIKHLEIVANQKNKKTHAAQFGLGIIYLHGVFRRGESRNLELCFRDAQKGIKYLELAADISDLKLNEKYIPDGVYIARYTLGVCYRDGIGVEKDQKKSDEYFQIVGDLSMDHAVIDFSFQDSKFREEMKILRKLARPELDYHRGLGFYNGQRKDNDLNSEKMAFESFYTAANGGHPRASYNLAICYLRGIGVLQNTKLGNEWLERAAKFVKKRGQIPELRSSIKIKKNRKFEYEPLAEAALKNLEHESSESNANVIAQCDLAFAYEQGGFGLKEDKEKSEFWYKKAAKNPNSFIVISGRDCGYSGERGFDESKYRLACKFENGSLGIDKNLNKAYQWHHYAAVLGNNKAQNKLNDLAEQARNAYLEDCRKKADAKVDGGNAISQFFMGWYYEKGVFVEQDIECAVKYYEKAAKQGMEKAQYHLGRYYEYHVDPSKRDITRAMEYYEKAAKRGLVDAVEALNHFSIQKPYEKVRAAYFSRQMKLAKKNVIARAFIGNAYLHGLWVEEDRWEAFKWYNEYDANESNACKNDKIQNSLGMMHEEGLGLRSDIELAKHYYERSSKQGNVEACENLRRLNYQGSHDESLTLEKTYFDSRLMLAKSGHPSHQVFIGLIYQYGNKFEPETWVPDPKRKGKWISKSRVDINMAMEWYEKAARQSCTTLDKQGYARAEYYLGVCYENKKMMREAIRHYELASEQNYIDTNEKLAGIIEEGDPIAQCDLGFCYELGRRELGIEQNLELALKYYQLAFMNGIKNIRFTIERVKDTISARNMSHHKPEFVSFAEENVKLKTAKTLGIFRDLTTQYYLDENQNNISNIHLDAYNHQGTELKKSVIKFDEYMCENLIAKLQEKSLLSSFYSRGGISNFLNFFKNSERNHENINMIISSYLGEADPFYYNLINGDSITSKKSHDEVNNATVQAIATGSKSSTIQSNRTTVNETVSNTKPLGFSNQAVTILNNHYPDSKEMELKDDEGFVHISCNMTKAKVVS